MTKWWCKLWYYEHDFETSTHQEFNKWGAPFKYTERVCKRCGAFDNGPKQKEETCPSSP